MIKSRLFSILFLHFHLSVKALRSLKKEFDVGLIGIKKGFPYSSHAVWCVHLLARGINAQQAFWVRKCHVKVFKSISLAEVVAQATERRHSVWAGRVWILSIYSAWASGFFCTEYVIERCMLFLLLSSFPSSFKHCNHCIICERPMNTLNYKSKKGLERPRLKR